MKKFFKQILLGFLCASAISLSACNSEPKKGDKNWIDYAAKGDVRLNLDYTGKDFYKDGIGQFNDNIIPSARLKRQRQVFPVRSVLICLSGMILIFRHPSGMFFRCFHRSDQRNCCRNRYHSA